MDMPDDLNEYLRGDSALSRQYRKESVPVPPALDRQVLALCAPVESDDVLTPSASGGSKHVPAPSALGGSNHALPLSVSRGSNSESPCLAPLALAASVLLSMAVVLAIVFGPQKSKRAEDAPRLIRVAAHADLSPAAPVNRGLRFYSGDPPRVRAPSQWLADIAALRRAGRTSQADAEFRRFRDAYPAYSVGEPAARP